MRRHPDQKLVAKAPLLHDLTGKFNRVRAHASDPGNVPVPLPRQEVLQTMAKLMHQPAQLRVAQ